MTLRKRKKFIRDLANAVRDEILASADKMPDYWNGFELRQLLADKFAGNTCQMSRKQMHDYRNEMTINNI